jgi:hypothetical protein
MCPCRCKKPSLRVPWILLSGVMPKIFWKAHTDTGRGIVNMMLFLEGSGHRAW